MKQALDFLRSRAPLSFIFGATNLQPVRRMNVVDADGSIHAGAEMHGDYRINVLIATFQLCIFLNIILPILQMWRTQKRFTLNDFLFGFARREHSEEDVACDIPVILGSERTREADNTTKDSKVLASHLNMYKSRDESVTCTVTSTSSDGSMQSYSTLPDDCHGSTEFQSSAPVIDIGESSIDGSTKSTQQSEPSLPLHLVEEPAISTEDAVEDADALRIRGGGPSDPTYHERGPSFRFSAIPHCAILEEETVSTESIKMPPHDEAVLGENDSAQLGDSFADSRLSSIDGSSKIVPQDEDIFMLSRTGFPSMLEQDADASSLPAEDMDSLNSLNDDDDSSLGSFSSSLIEKVFDERYIKNARHKNRNDSQRNRNVTHRSLRLLKQLSYRSKEAVARFAKRSTKKGTRNSSTKSVQFNEYAEMITFYYEEQSYSEVFNLWYNNYDVAQQRRFWKRLETQSNTRLLQHCFETRQRRSERYKNRREGKRSILCLSQKNMYLGTLEHTLPQTNYADLSRRCHILAHHRALDLMKELSVWSPEYQLKLKKPQKFRHWLAFKFENTWARK